MTADRPASWDEYDARLASAMSLYREDMTPDELNALRRSAGTLGGASAFLGSGRGVVSRFLWWAFDVEYVAVGPPPIFFIVPVGVLVACLAALVWMLS